MASGLDAEVLRTLGEDLDLRGIKTFAIKCEADVFVIEGGYQYPPAVTPVTIHYKAEDLEQLERKGRDHLSATRSFIYLAEILSAVGVYVGDRRGSLLSLSNMASSESRAVIDIEYETTQGERKSERLADADIYSLCIRRHKRREKRAGSNEMRYTRFSSLPARA
jgi:hypothetical protein